MSKYVVFSFDDGRRDQYEVAYKVLKDFGFPATINVVSEFINNEENFVAFKTMDNKSLSWDNLKEMSTEGGWEIACHGATHKNNKEDIDAWFEEKEIIANNWDKDVGFASPTSYVSRKNYSSYIELVKNNRLKYIRSGKRLREAGALYAFKNLINRYIQNKKLFVNLNRDCIINRYKDIDILMAVSITCYDTVDEIIALIDAMKNDEAIIIMFHSVINKNDTKRAKDKWYWEVSNLKKLCSILKKDENIQVVTTRKMVNIFTRKHSTLNDY